MSKRITSNQLLGESGEAAVRQRFLKMGFQFDVRGRLEAGIDGIAEVMDNDGQALAKMIAVQVKSTDKSKYVSEDENGFTYLLRSKDLAYWRGSNIPVIIVLYRRSDESFYWKEVNSGTGEEERRLYFDKQEDVLDEQAVNKLAEITVPKKGFGHYVPPLGGGEEALVNILPISFPDEIYVASTPYGVKQARAILFDEPAPPRFDWVIRGGSFWSFHDPRTSSCEKIVDLDQVEVIETSYLAFHEDADERYAFVHLLRETMRRQVYADLMWDKDKKLFYFKAKHENQSRTFQYEASKKKSSTDVVNVVKDKKNETQVGYVRHHAFIPRFENLYDQWFLVVNPTYHFTYNGFTPHSYPHALLAGKKRLDNSASLRGQVIMWHRFLTQAAPKADDLFVQYNTEEPCLRFGEPPTVSLSVRVPEDVWGIQKKKADNDSGQESLKLA
jgi:hypothetical protein